MTQINKDNWAEVFPLFLAKTLDPNLAFVAFDLEMTGINLEGTDFNSNNAWADSPVERFVKVAKVASRFSICQVGICLFFQSPGKSDKLECDAYNIDTFDSRRDLAASPGALSFLAANGFDFNEWIKRGVPIVNASDEQRLRSKHARRIEEAQAMVRAAVEAERLATNGDEGGAGELQGNEDAPSSTAVDSALVKQAEGNEEGSEPAAKRAAVGANKPTAVAANTQRRHMITLDRAADREVASAALQALRSWLTEVTVARRVAALAKALGDSDDGEASASSSAESAPLEIVLGPFPWAGLRKYMYQQLETDPAFAGLVTEKRPEDKIAVLALTGAQARARAQAQQAAAEAELMSSLGARPAFTALVEAARRGVPVVGHNCLADLCFLLQAFDAPILEPDFNEVATPAGEQGHEDEGCYTKTIDATALYEAWKMRVHDLFPRVIDTKHLAVLGMNAEWWVGGSTSLDALMDTFDPIPATAAPMSIVAASSLSTEADAISVANASNRLKLVVLGERYAPDAAAYHEAGWDALCTGRVLVRMIEAATAHTQSDSPLLGLGGLQSPHFPFSLQLGALTSAQNALTLMRSPYVVSLGASSDGPAPGGRNAVEVARRTASAALQQEPLVGTGEGARELAAPGSSGVVTWLRSLVGLGDSSSVRNAPQKRRRSISNFFGF